MMVTTPSTGARTIDPIKFEVIRNALLAATEEMSVSLQRSAYSTNVKTRLDYSCAFFDRHCRIVAQAFSQPGHLLMQAHVTGPSILEYGPERLEPGDAIVVNDPHRGANHLNDLFFISPVFYRGELFGFLGSSAHHVDMGGGAPCSLGAFTEIYQEGICLPVIKLVHRGEFHPDLFKFLMANIRATKEVAGDMRAQIASNNLGARRICALLDRYGPDEVQHYIDELIAYTERRTRAELAKLPPGVYEAEAFLDDDGIDDRPIRFQVKVTIGDGRVAFDFTGTDLQRRGPMNCSKTMTTSGCLYVLKCLIDPDIPLNHGFFNHVEVHVPEGTCLNARRPAAVVGGQEVCMRINELVFKAFSQALPEKVPAGTKGMVCHTAFGGLRPDSGEYYTFLETIAGGYGGRIRSDGPDAIQTHIQNTQNAPIEETELNYPVEILRYNLIDDSDGPGKFRGGLGLRRDYRFIDHEPSFTFLADRRKFAPWGLFGGMPGKLATYFIVRDGQVIPTGSKVTFIARQGDVISAQSCGGGGYGNPFERDPQRVLADVVERKVSVERARLCYGVVVDPVAETVDEAATAAFRATHQPQEPAAT
ncbi:MAG: hydantoinase B/oxoprolinase family protein [Chloroflexi bacterium]|nr:hydantoinase B/oxoprolinase family protein [Chloroflexota bacterium]